MIASVSHQDDHFLRKMKRLFYRVATQSKLAFGPSLRRSMVLMIIIIAIQFGYVCFTKL